MNSTSEEDFESDSDNSIIESEAFQKHKKEAILFEAIKVPLNKILKSESDDIEDKLKKIKKDDLKHIVKKIKKTINVSKYFFFIFLK